MCVEYSRQWLVKRRRHTTGANSVDNRMKPLSMERRHIIAAQHEGKTIIRTINKALIRSSWSWPQLARVKLCPYQIVEVLLALVLVNYVAESATLVAGDGAANARDDSAYGLYRNPNRMGYFGYKTEELPATENHLQRSQNFKISPKPCSFGHIEGTCMFVWECIKSEGRHVGMCVDSFMFGSCCSHNYTDNIVLPPTMFAYTRPSKPMGSFNSNFSQRPRPPHMPNRPAISGMTTIERPHGAGTLVIRPSGPHHQGALHRPQNTKPPTSTQRTTVTDLGSTMNHLNAHWSSNVVIDDQHSAASAVPTSPLNTIWHSSLSSLSPAATYHQHWHMTTEPNFITKPRPPSWEKPKPLPLRPSKPQKPTKKPIVSESPALLPQTTSSTVQPKPSTTKPQNQLLPTTSIAPLTWISSPTTTHNTKPTKLSTSTTRPFTRPTLSWSTAQRPTVLSSSTTPGGGGGAPTKTTLASTTQKYWSTTSGSPVLQALPTNHSTLPPPTPMRTTTRTPTRNSTTPVTTLSTSTASLSATATSDASESAIETNEINDTNGGTQSAAVAAATGTVKTISAARTECGTPLLARPETRIVGGKSAAFGRWPWQVSVRRTSFFGFSSTHRCGGALINENWIATAGHCVDDLLISQIRIRVGEYDFSHVQEQLPYIERGVAKKVVHPKYNFFTYEYDLALVKLEQPLEFAPHVSPICLPETDSLLIGMNATVTGWGRLSEGGTLPSVLQEVSVPIVSNDNCKSMFLRAGRQEFIPDIFLCAGYETGGQDSCQGDSGGPLQVRSQNGRFFLAGIISWGIGCAEANLPGVCTRISKFVPWILSNVR